MASKEELLASIQPGMKLTKNFFLRIYGYEISFPGFAENALTRMEILGCSKARNYYTGVVSEYDYNHEKDMKNVAAWYRKQDFVIKKGEDSNKTGKERRERHKFAGFPEDW